MSCSHWCVPVSIFFDFSPFPFAFQECLIQKFQSYDLLEVTDCIQTFSRSLPLAEKHSTWRAIETFCVWEVLKQIPSYYDMISKSRCHSELEILPPPPEH